MWQAVRVGGDCANNIAHIVYTRSCVFRAFKITNKLLRNKLRR